MIDNTFIGLKPNELLLLTELPAKKVPDLIGGRNRVASDGNTWFNSATQDAFQAGAAPFAYSRWSELTNWGSTSSFARPDTIPASCRL